MNEGNTAPVAVVTGAAGGIGQAITSELLKNNYHLALLDKDEAGLSQVIANYSEQAEHLHVYGVDITDEAQVASVMARVVSDLGRLDVLVNNAGILRDGLLVKAKDSVVKQKLALDDWQAVLSSNLTGVFLCGREAAAQMIQCGNGGTIINMSSLARYGNFGQSSYGAAKAGVAALTVTWAQELSRFGIRVAGIAPGVIKTRMTAGMKPEALEALSKKVPVSRLGDPDEVASAVAFILNNAYLNGRIIELDGGLRF